MRKIAIASILLSEKIKIASDYLKIPKNVFQDILSEIKSLEGVRIIYIKPNKGIFECNGLMKDIRRAVKKMQNKYKQDYRIEIHNSSASQRKRCLIEIRNKLFDMPEKAKAQYKDNDFYFCDGPFKGEKVHWSTRLENVAPNENEVGDDIFLIKPDLYRATFYGWKVK